MHANQYGGENKDFVSDNNLNSISVFQQKIREFRICIRV